MEPKTMLIVCIVSVIVTMINSALWLREAMSERRWQHIGDSGAFAFRRMWINLGLALVFGMAALVGYYWSLV